MVEIMKKKTKRKHYALINPINHAILGAGITQEHLLDKLRLRELSAMDVMSKGRGDRSTWQELVDMMNISEVMALNGIGPEVLPYCQIAQDDLQKAAKRYEKTGKMGLTGEGLKALREVYEYHDLQRRSIPRSLYEQMIVKTRKRLLSQAKEVVVL